LKRGTGDVTTTVLNETGRAAFLLGGRKPTPASVGLGEKA
jgi:hypothetical protein